MEQRMRLNRDMARMLKGGVIMDVVDATQARIAEEAGAVAVMALERVPSEIRKQGGVARMSDPLLIESIQKAVSIPVMAKVRIGHTAEAMILQSMGIDFIDESEVLTPADEQYHIDKHRFQAPFVCGAKDLSQALRRIDEGAAMIRTKGEAGTGNIVEAVRHQRAIASAIVALSDLDEGQLESEAGRMGIPPALLKSVATSGTLPVVNFAAGGIATPADAALMMLLGSQGVFVGSGIFTSDDPAARAAAIVKAVSRFDDASYLCEVSKGLGEAMRGLELSELEGDQKFSQRGV